MKLYVPLEYSAIEKFEGEKYIKNYRIKIPKGNYVIYGNLVSSENNDVATLKINNFYSTDYFCWLAPSVFYIPTLEQEDKVDVELTSKTKCNVQQEQFYALQLDILKEISDKISEKEANIVNMENGNIHLNVQYNENDTKQEKLLITIPYDSGWKIMVNNKEVKPEIFADCLMLIPLERGNNDIEMEYTLPYLKISIVITMIGIILFIIIMMCEKKYYTNI